MADGKTHFRTQISSAAIWTLPAFLYWVESDDPHHWLLFAGLGVGSVITPDLDVDSQNVYSTYLVRKKFGILAYLWCWYWWPYAKIFKHGGSSHWLGIGTLVRFALTFWPLFIWLEGDKTWLWWVYGGMAIADSNHIFMDIPNGTSRWAEAALFIIHLGLALFLVNIFLI